MPVDTIGTLRCGTKFGDVVQSFKDAAFVGFNCIDAKSMTAQIKYLRSVVPKKQRISAYGNIGYWVPPPPGEYAIGEKQNNTIEHDAIYVKEVKKWVEAGASIIGGCCGTPPDTIRMLYGII